MPPSSHVFAARRSAISIDRQNADELICGRTAAPIYAAPQKCHSITHDLSFGSTEPAAPYLISSQAAALHDGMQKRARDTLK